MRKLMEMTKHLAVFALGLGLVTTGWAAASLEETGATVPTTATLAFKGATLSQVTADTLSAAFGGGSAGTATGEAPTFNNFDRTSEASGTITCEAQVANDGYIKAVLLTFTQSGSDVNVVKSGAKYITGSAVGPSTASGSTGNYDINKLKLTLGKPTPIAVFDGASGGFKKTSINGVTFAANGNTVADDGSYVKISASVGALFKLGQGYSYVVGEFTVTNLNESAAADRVLALWSPTEDGTSTASPGVLLKSGTVDTRGVWLNELWGDSQTTLNGSLATGISTDASRTFALATEDSNNNNYPGTHLFELTGANPGTAVYGGTGNMGLRGAQTYRTFAIGGPATGSLSAMTDLVITKVVIYASDSRQFTSTDPTTIANVENPAAFYVGNGETINASAINAGVTASGAAYVYTEAGATLNLDAELMGRATFSGSISGVPVSTIGLTLDSENDKVTLANASYDHVFKGTGTVVYPDNTIPSASAIWLKSSDWAGTLSLNNIQGSSSGQPGWYAPFHNYGSANSTIKVSGFTGFFAAGNYESPATLEIAAGSTFTLNNGNGGNSMTFAKLTGSGDIVICGDNTPAIQYVMRDASEFAGNITVSQSGSSSFCKSIVLGGGSSYNYSTGKYQKQICVLGNVTIAAGKTWTADSGIVVDGTLTLAASDSSMPVVASGTGKIVCNNKVPNNSGLTASTWTGTLEINADTTSGTVSGSTQFMNAASKLNLAEGYLSLTGVSELPGEVSVASGAILYLGKTDATTASVKVGTLGGAISTQFATSLETLTLDLGTARTFDWTKINQGNNQNLTVNISLTEVSGENGTTVFTPANFNGNNTYNYTIKHIDGSVASATTVIDGETGVVTFTYVPQVDGDACWHAYEFNSTYTSSNVHYYPDSVSTDQRDCRTWDYADPDLCDDTDPDKGGNKFIYTIICPGPNKAYDYPTEWSAAIRCTTPSTANSIIVAFGNSNSGNYIALVSGDTAGKVRLVSGSGSNPVEEITPMTVANPTTSQHVYVFTKTASAVTVYCDGDLIVSKPLSLTIGSGFQFGTIYGGTKDDCGLSRVSSRETAGMVDYTRLYDFAISDDMIQKLAQDDPYDSSTPTYSREVSGSPWWYTGDGTWLKSDDSALVGVPDVAGIVDLTATADATMTVNLPAAPVYEKLTFQGAGAVTLVKNGNSPKIATAKLVVKTNVTAPYDIADFSGARVSVDAGKVLTFDFSTYPLESVTGVTTQQVTGVTTRADDRYSVVASAKPAWNSRLSLIYDPVEYVYSVVIDPAALVTKNNTTVAYPTVADALTALSTDAGTVRLLVDYDQDITLSAGQTLDVGSTTYSGTASATGQYAELVHSGTTWKAVDNSVNTWKSSVTAGHWNTASNWENGVIPKTYTRVTFPANDDPEFTGYTVTVKISGNYDAGWTPVCTGMVVNAKVDMVQDASGSDWGTIHLGGNISGTGTLALHKIGLYNALGPSTPITVSCGLSVAIKDAADQDCYLYGGPFVFEGAVTATSNVLFKAEYCAATFNGPVTMENGTTINGNGTGTTVYNGGISVPADAAATLEGSGRVTIASTVTLASGATLTVPNATTVSGATFATSVADSYVKATAGESTTVYSVAAKRTATVSVGANAALSINGNAVADGDTLKFVPGDVLTIAASADTYYTPALTVNEVAQTSPYELTTTDADVTVSVTATRDTVTITIPPVVNTTVSVSYTSGGEELVATAAGDITVDAGTDVTATWTAASGYKITSGASHTLNAVTFAQPLTSPTVGEKSVTVSEVCFTYTGYNTAKVTAKVTYDNVDATTYVLTIGGSTYEAELSATKVATKYLTFTDVAITESVGEQFSYSIAPKDESVAVATGCAGVSYVGDANGWIDESKATTGQTGSWTDANSDPVADPYGDNDYATILDGYTFTPNEGSSGSRVTITLSDVCFGDVNEETSVGDDAQAAIKIVTNGNALAFAVLTNSAQCAWAVVNGLAPTESMTNDVTVVIDYGDGTYSVNVDDHQLYLGDDTTATAFPIAKSGVTQLNSLGFKGEGSLTSIVGEYYTSNMVVDNNGTQYATVDDAVQAFATNLTVTSLTLLHDLGPGVILPACWTVVGEGGVLVCTAAAYAVDGGLAVYYPTLQGAIDEQMFNDESAVTNAVVLLTNNVENVVLTNLYSVKIARTTHMYTNNVPAANPTGAYAVEASDDEPLGSYTTTYTARDWYEWTLTLDAGGATVNGIADGDTVSETNSVVSFTVAPAAGSVVESVTAQVSGEAAETLEATAGEFTYNVTNNVTITVVSHEAGGVPVPSDSGETATSTTKIVSVPKSDVQLTAATLINLDNRDAGDELKVYNKSTGSYMVWRFCGDKYADPAWEPTTVYKASGSVTTTENTTSADLVELSAGQGVWVTYNPQKPLFLNGIYATEPSAVPVTAGYNLVAPPPRENSETFAISTNTVKGAVINDRIVVPRASGKPPLNLVFNGTEWGVWDTEIDQDGFGTQEWKPSTEIPDAAVKYGLGFWYISTRASATIEL